MADVTVREIVDAAREDVRRYEIARRLSLDDGARQRMMGAIAWSRMLSEMCHLEWEYQQGVNRVPGIDPSGVSGGERGTEAAAVATVPSEFAEDVAGVSADASGVRQD